MLLTTKQIRSLSEVIATKKRTLVQWTDQQKKLTLDYFKQHLKNKKPPRKDDCERLQQSNGDVFSNKTWRQIKVYICNTYNKKVTETIFSFTQLVTSSYYREIIMTV